ncbi:MAG: inorganic phosphate transporter [Elusimicrobia bacterium]|nr:inorganic phosphate transporter [Elusimicrobiota bacterium]
MKFVIIRVSERSEDMDTVILIAGFVVALALFFDFTNGFNDSGNMVATVISSNALTPEVALTLAAISEFIGAYFLGTAVAETIVKGIVDPRLLQTGPSGVIVIISALIGAILWNLSTWYFGIPSSSSHALIGGLIGAFLFGWGPKVINWIKVWHIVLIMILSPFAGLIITYIFTRFTLVFSQWSSPKANRVFQKLQIVSCITQALAHGTNDAQKTMGVITFALVILGLHNISGSQLMLVPHWVVISCALTISLGMGVGGWRIIKTLGNKLYKIRPIHGFASQTASTLIIYFTALFGYPISTTQVVSSSIMGAGSAFRPKMVRWQVAQDMMVAWLITIPASGIMAGLIFYILNKTLI